MESVDIVNGIPQGRAIFSDVNDSPAGGYGIWEIDRENPYNSNLIGMGFGSYELRLVTTTHGETDGNDATIDHRTWTDYVSVINTYVPIPEPESDPAETPDPASDPLVPSSPTPFTPVNPGTPEVPVEAAGVINNLNDGLTIEDYMTPLAGGINMNEGDCFN